MATTARGHIEKLPAGSFRVHVYAGTDPVTGKPQRLKQTCPDEAPGLAWVLPALNRGTFVSKVPLGRFPGRDDGRDGLPVAAGGRCG